MGIWPRKTSLGLPAGGQPDELGNESGADDGGLLAFDQGNRLLREERQQVFAEETFEDDGVEEGGEEAGEVRRTVGP